MNNKQIKLLKFLGTIAVIGGGITTTILTTSCGKTLSDIASIINVRNLGVIESNTEDVIKSKIEDLNSNASNLKWSQLQITAITSTSAYISAIENSTVYKGYAKITFTLPEKVNISSIISIIDLEEVESATEQAIQTKVVELNSEAGNLE
jgi:tellurite resistance protein TehA-like permease